METIQYMLVVGVPLWGNFIFEVVGSTAGLVTPGAPTHISNVLFLKMSEDIIFCIVCLFYKHIGIISAIIRTFVFEDCVAY